MTTSWSEVAARVGVTLGMFGLVAGCVLDAPPHPDHTGQAGVALTEEELNAKALEMLNHETTDLKVLDVDAALTSTAAKNLLAHRNGPDGVLGTEDDDPFDSIQEVDDISGVGPSALGKILAFAETWEPPDPNAEPPPVDELEAKVLAMLNHGTTTLTILDIDAGLTATAAKNLVQHRDGPDGLFGTADDDLFDSMQEVDDVKYVGASAIAQLEAYATTWTPETNSQEGPVDVPKVLQFLNNAATTHKVLLEEVGLNTTQTSNIVAWRDGADEESGTDDDNLFDTIAELDSVKYIGPKTIAKIEAYAAEWEPVDPEKVLEQKVLDFLNHPLATLTVLDIDAGLTSSSAKALIAHKNGPDELAGTEDDDLFDSLQEVDDVKYVGASALNKIKAFAETWDPEAQAESNIEEVADNPLSCKTCGIFAGDPTEFDPGPPAGSGWAELFAAVPNFRMVAQELGEQWLVVNPETGLTKLDEVNAERALEEMEPIPLYTLTKNKFRYHMGPLFYRGRLDGTARVLVVGQEGATDEALVHRAFTGGTGQKVQNFLNAIGITRDYLLLNTFVYSIYEQYDEFTAELALSGPIKDHRNQIFEKVFQENDIQLVLTFGNAAYNSVKIFREEYYAGKFPKGTRWSHMLHPGAAALAYAPDSTGTVIDAGTLGAVVKSFSDSWKHIWYWRYIDPGWLPADEDAWATQGFSYYFGDRDIPYRDLPYGASPQIGRGGTKSERAKSGLQVQLRSSNGVRYEAPSLAFPSTVSKALSGYEAPEGDLSWEPTKIEPDLNHDPGPSAEWVPALAATPAQAIAEEEAQVDANNDFHQVPLWYRGHLNGPVSVLVIAQDYGTDQVIAGRTLIGDNGQKIGHLLHNIGAGSDYLMISPYPYPLNDTVADYDVLNLAQSPTLATYRQQLLQKILADNPVVLVLTFGEVAEAAFMAVADQYAGDWLHLAHPSEAAAAVSWNAALATLEAEAAGLGLSGDFLPYSLATFLDVRRQIPRADLPWGSPRWFGTSGDLSQQPDKSWIFWNAPKWVKSEPAGG